MTDESVNTTSTTETTPTSEGTADLTLQDLAALKSIIDVASSRGSFKPNEMVVVGTIYSKLEKFLELAQKQNQPAQGQATPNA